MKKPATNKTRLPASRAHLWAHCGGSVKLKAAGNPFAPFDAARKGILTHSIASMVLQTHFKHPVTDAGFSAWEKQLWEANREEIDEAVEFYVDYIKEAWEDFKAEHKDAEMHIEKQLTTETDLYIFQGPPDVYFVSADEVRVFDLKSGFMEVEAEGNEQLILYGHQVARTHKLKNPKLSGVIVQPLLSQVAGPAYYFFDPEFFESIFVDLQKFSVGAHCTKCPALTVCKAAQAKIKAFTNPEYADATVSREKVWKELLGIAAPGKEFYDRLIKEAKTALEVGVKIEGWGLGKGRVGKRVWKETVSADRLAKELKLKKTQVAKTVLETPAAVEKLAKDSKEKIRALVYQPEYPTLIRTEKEEAFMSAKKTKTATSAAGKGGSKTAKKTAGKTAIPKHKDK